MFLLVILSLANPPQFMKGVYLSPGVVGSGKGISRFFYMVDMGYINTAVVDIKEVDGIIRLKLYKTFIKRAKEHNLYLIARMTVFKDKYLALKDNGKYALKTPTGKIWYDPVSGYWVDPENRDVWEYNLKIAEKAAKMGFDEIQFDYVRYPSSHIPYRIKGSKTDILLQFCDFIKHKLDPIIWTGIDFYGFAAWNDTIKLEGQSLPEMSKRVDAVYPMLYPSHFGNRFLYSSIKEKRTYNIIYKSLLNVEIMVPDRIVRVVGYIQAFDWKKSTLGKEYVKNQIKAVYDAGGDGFILWHAAGDYKLAYRELIEYEVERDLSKLRSSSFEDLRFTLSPSRP